MSRKQQYNNGANRNNQTPRNNGPNSNGSCNTGKQNNGPFNNRPNNNGPNNNTPLNNGPQNGNQRFNPRTNNSNNTNFYNRVSHNNNQNNNSHQNRRFNNNNYNNNSNNNGNTCANSGGNGNNSNDNGNANSNPQGAIHHSSSPGGRQPDGRFYINNTVVTHPTPRTHALDAAEPKNQFPKGTSEDRYRIIQGVCDYYKIGSLRDLLQEPDYAPEEWDNLLLNKICLLRNHEVSLVEIRDGLSRHIRQRLRKGTKRSDRPVKPYILAQDAEALIKEVDKARQEQSEPEAAITSPTPHKNKNKTTPPTGPKKRTSSSALVSEQPASTKRRRRRIYVSPEPSVGTDSDESPCSVVPQVSDEEFLERIYKIQQKIARVRDVKFDLTTALTAIEEEGDVLNRMVEQRTRRSM